MSVACVLVVEGVDYGQFDLIFGLIEEMLAPGQLNLLMVGHFNCSIPGVGCV